MFFEGKVYAWELKSYEVKIPFIDDTFNEDKDEGSNSSDGEDDRDPNLPLGFMIPMMIMLASRLLMW